MHTASVKPGKIPITQRGAVAGALAAAPRFHPVRQQRTFEEICHRIRTHLAAGALRPGDKLPPERDLAEQLGVGRNALREALRALETAGIVERRRGARGGAFIREGDPRRMEEVVSDLLSQGAITVRHLAEARVHMLELVVRLACERAGEAELAAIEANIERMRRATLAHRVAERLECSHEFYRLLGAATANPVLAMTMHALSDLLMQFVQARLAAGGKLQPRLVESRRELLQALRRRDPATAVRLMRAHLEGVHRMLESSIDAAGHPRDNLMPFAR